jgi:hypothetical protein
MKVMQSLNH